MKNGCEQTLNGLVEFIENEVDISFKAILKRTDNKHEAIDGAIRFVWETNTSGLVCRCEGFGNAQECIEDLISIYSKRKR